jgi:hypothetical protein
MGDRMDGVAIHIGARVAALAKASEVLVSSTVKDLVAGNKAAETRPDHGCRIDLAAAMLCLDLECNTVFDAAMYQTCPSCGGAECYHLTAWLNRRFSSPSRADSHDGCRERLPIGWEE